MEWKHNLFFQIQQLMLKDLIHPSWEFSPNNICSLLLPNTNCMCFLLFFWTSRHTDCFTESVTWSMAVYIAVSSGKLEPFLCRSDLVFLRNFMVDGGEFTVEESLNVRPDLVGLCAREALQHTFAPVGENVFTVTIWPVIPVLHHNCFKIFCTADTNTLNSNQTKILVPPAFFILCTSFMWWTASPTLLLIKKK